MNSIEMCIYLVNQKSKNTKFINNMTIRNQKVKTMETIKINEKEKERLWKVILIIMKIMKWKEQWLWLLRIIPKMLWLFVKKIESPSWYLKIHYSWTKEPWYFNCFWYGIGKLSQYLSGFINILKQVWVPNVIIVWFWYLATEKKRDM